MTGEPRERVSVISESSAIVVPSHFAAAFGWGTLAGTAALCFGFFILSDFEVELGDIIEGLIFFGIFVGVFVLAGMVLIGLPITFLLRNTRLEYALLYAGLGAVLGFLVIFMVFDVPRVFHPAALLFPISGALAGLASALRWGTWRERAARERQREQLDHPSDKRDNPIHDLTH